MYKALPLCICKNISMYKEWLIKYFFPSWIFSLLPKKNFAFILEKPHFNYVLFFYFLNLYNGLWHII